MPVSGNTFAANSVSENSPKHTKLDELQGQRCLDKHNTLRGVWMLNKVAFTRPHSDRYNIMQASFVVSELIAKRLNPHSVGEFVKECLVAPTDMLTLNKVKLFQSVGLSRATIAEHK